MTRLAYYPGCSLHGTAREMDSSFRASAKALDVELAEIPGWECCGNTAAHSASRLLATALPANEITKVRRDMKLDSVVVPCAACYSRFQVAKAELDHDDQLRRETELVVGRAIPTDINVLNLVDVYYDAVGLDALAARVKHPLGGIKVAAYYGCLLTRPPKTTLAEDPECPTRMDDVLKALGAEPVAWGYKTDCCGASLALCEQAVVVELTRRVLVNARDCGAEAVACACPLCQVNLDTRQADIKANDPSWRDIPIFYLSQLVGHAVGAPAAEMGFKKHMVAVPALP